MVQAVVGANWGDEGKGKITDMLAEKADTANCSLCLLFLFNIYYILAYLFVFAFYTL